MALFLGRCEHATFVPDIKEAVRATRAGKDINLLTLSCEARPIVRNQWSKVLRLNINSREQYKRESLLSSFLLIVSISCVCWGWVGGCVWGGGGTLYVPTCLCSTVSVFHCVFILPCLCSNTDKRVLWSIVSLIHRVSVPPRVYDPPCLCSRVKLGLDTAD